MKMKHVSRACICLGLTALTAVSFALWNGRGMTAYGEEMPQPRMIQYADLEALVKEYSPQIQMERAEYNSRLGWYEKAREEMTATRRLLREEADDMEKDGDPSGAENYRKQAKTLEEAAKDMDKQIRAAKSSSSTRSLRQMEDAVTWAAQSLTGTYHSLKLEQAEAAAQAELKAGLKEKAQRLAAAGGLSQRQADEADQAAADAAVRARSLEDEMDRVKGQLAMLLGFGSGEEIEIAPMPVPDSTQADSIVLAVDQWRALGNNYELRSERGAAFSGTNKELHSRQRRIRQNEENLYGQVETLYQNVLASRTAWNSAVTAMAAAEAKWQADSHKMALGMLSNQEYLEAKAAYLAAAAAKGQADVDFQQAMDTYNWAVKGYMQ